MVGGIVGDERNNFCCGRLGLDTADDAEPKLMFAAQHCGCFVSGLRKTRRAVANPSIDGGLGTLNESSLASSGQREGLLAEGDIVTFTAPPARMGGFGALTPRSPCTTCPTAHHAALLVDKLGGPESGVLFMPPSAGRR
jgi:hypothetical protein